MSVTQAELHRHWGLSRQRISQMRKEGMPLETLEVAETWRTAKYGPTCRHGRKNVRSLLILKTQQWLGLPADVTDETVKRSDLVGVWARASRSESVSWQLLQAAIYNSHRFESAMRRMT